jgi:hypothetical protein
VNGDKAARVLAGLAVLAVAVVAGIVSFSHIEALALAHGYSIGTARLLPVSVDGLIVASSLALLTEARAEHPKPGLARAGLILGIVATLAANVAAGVQFGAVGVLVNVWPAVSFVVASELLLRMTRADRGAPSVMGEAGTVAEVPTALATMPETVAASVPVDVPVTSVSVPEHDPVVVLGPVPGDMTPVASLRPVPARTPRRTSPGKPKAPARVFRAEVERGELPSLRAIKSRMHVGTDRARVIRDQLGQALESGAVADAA